MSSSYVLGAFASEPQTLSALRSLRERGYRELDLHSPFPVEGAADALGLSKSWIRWAALAGALLGGAAGYAVQWWTNAFNWPLDVGDRPLRAWPAFTLLTYEGLILASSFAIFLALLAAWRLPNLHHPVLGAAGFETATASTFWVSVGASSELERDLALEALGALGAAEVQSVGGDTP